MVHFDLTLSFTETATGLQGQWEYNTDLFHPETIRQLADSFLTLLTTAVNTPHQPLNRLLRLTDEEAAMLLVEWNATQQDYPDHHCLHHLVEAQAQRTPRQSPSPLPAAN